MRESAVKLLRCAVNSVATAAAQYGVELPRVREDVPYVDPRLPDAVAEAAAWVDTMWEVRTILASGVYPDVTRMSIIAGLYLAFPRAGNLERYGTDLTTFLLAAAQARGAQQPCGVLVRLDGLAPLMVQDPQDIPDADGGIEEPDDDVPEPPAPALRHRAALQPSRSFGHLVMGGMLATAVGLTTKAVAVQLKAERRRRR